MIFITPSIKINTPLPCFAIEIGSAEMKREVKHIFPFKPIQKEKDLFSGFSKVCYSFMIFTLKSNISHIKGNYLALLCKTSIVGDRPNAPPRLRASSLPPDRTPPLPRFMS